ncbi:plexin domain-containing protein 2-like [Condylostylus longicornis]|uniref:plexin domain-containing protein 2-like n=1 Tax=Condylostylus longicornis TaxID=2530218 RepID=UPI00244DAA5D|nr:plexin domain-containing protein 2-like [Condylostylus longicornis]
MEALDAFKAFNPNKKLSSGARKAFTVQLKFDFPYFGAPIKNITVANGGFIYTGEYVHPWLAALQYIAPLMANFDPNLSEDSFVKYFDNGTAFHILWENMLLRDKPEVGPFTFSTTLHDNGDIVFVYYNIPVKIDQNQDGKSPFKVGLSNAYLIYKNMKQATKGKSNFDHQKFDVNFENVQNNSIVYLKALPNCLQYTDCVSCANHKTTFDCGWCPDVNKCAAEVGKKSQDWIKKGKTVFNKLY